MTSSRLHDVFLSYSRKDTEMMHRVRNTLIAEGITVWTDEGIEAGTPSWQAAIENAIENARVIIVLLSPEAKNSEWVKRELSHAQTHELKIFPIMVRGDEKTAIPFGLAGSQHVDLRAGFSPFSHKLIPTITEYLGIESVSKIRERLAQKEARLEQIQRDLQIERENLANQANSGTELVRLQQLVEAMKRQQTNQNQEMLALKEALEAKEQELNQQRTKTDTWQTEKHQTSSLSQPDYTLTLVGADYLASPDVTSVGADYLAVPEVISDVDRQPLLLR